MVQLSSHSDSLTALATNGFHLSGERASGVSSTPRIAARPRSKRSSSTARKRSSLLLKFEYTAPLVNPAVAAISSRDDPWKPSRANTMGAASRRGWRVMARRRSGVRGSKVVTGPPALLTYPHQSRILLGMQATRQDRTGSRVAAGEHPEAQAWRA